MKIAIPIANGKLALHFGHASQFALIDADPQDGRIRERRDIDAPPHQPGMLPPWLASHGAETIIAGGMGQRARGLFEQNGIRVVTGAPSSAPEQLAREFLSGELRSGANPCDH
jgi:predicted Fe-Mo cluster-binding NifX family protein